jgi:hypothetical protein
MPFSCTICAEESTAICARCTQDTCRNHLCERCRRCSDCCECEVLLEEDVHEMPHVPVRAVYGASTQIPLPEEKDEEDWQPPPDPDPLPPEDPEPGPVMP